ncbi:MAG: methyltransferase domain-containing protein, partial [Halobacteria archaeon]|nr:methyltransferase domain-containing protein [Halobacteria archaeon]
MGRRSMNPEQYYDEFGMGEWDRLDQNPVAHLEYENTVSTLDGRLPPDGRVLDAGGGPGRYSIWLAEQGYRVEHFDLSSEQVRIAREKAEEHGVADLVT